ncbi:MAG: phage minor capsid protein [Lachnospiraceae bacterium]|nr:phage minor capsid protein [Bacteroides fragilis]MCM1218983.1 phage minor capsid protein [Lachnospiraceae bacterium]
MFTPEHLNELVEKSHAAATEFNMYLTNKVIDSMVNLFEQHGEIKIIPSNRQRLKLLNEQSGILVSDIEKEIRKRLPGLEKKIRAAFLNAGYEINEDINKSVADMVNADKELKAFVGEAPRLKHLTESEKSLLDAAYKRTRGEIRNLTKTTAADLNQQFMKSCDSAWWKATHGVDKNTAIREAINEVSKYGTHVIYRKNGKERKMTVEAATRMCVLTGINQANAEITLSHCADIGIKTVLVSSHIGARYTDHDEPANHMSWQGKVYSLSDKLLKEFGYTELKKNVFGKIKEFFQKFRKKETYPDFETVTGYGTITGLCGVNCRHTFHPFDPKHNSNPYKDYDNEESKQKYDLSQKQRVMERRIRETKKRLYNIRHSIKSLTDEKQIAAMKLEEAEVKKLFERQFVEYEAFCKQNGLRIDQERLYVGNQNG